MPQSPTFRGADGAPGAGASSFFAVGLAAAAVVGTAVFVRRFEKRSVREFLGLPPVASGSLTRNQNGAVHDDEDLLSRARTLGALPSPHHTNSTRTSARSEPHGPFWQTLSHHGVLFPPPYQPHGVAVIYNGTAVHLTPEQEELATMYAQMLDKDYITEREPVFLANFWREFQRLLGPEHTIKCLEHCDFSYIYEMLGMELAMRLKLSCLMQEDERQCLREAMSSAVSRYTVAVVDGRNESVHEFKVPPPSPFRGHGAHPLAGRICRRLMPEDVIINIGEDTPVPAVPIPGHSWKAVVHDRCANWIAKWQHPLLPKQEHKVCLGGRPPLDYARGQSCDLIFDVDGEPSVADPQHKDDAQEDPVQRLDKLVDSLRSAYGRLLSSDWSQLQLSTILYLCRKMDLAACLEVDDGGIITMQEVTAFCMLRVKDVKLPRHAGSINLRTVAHDFDNTLEFDFFHHKGTKLQVEAAVLPAMVENVLAFCICDVNGKKKVPESVVFDAISMEVVFSCAKARVQRDAMVAEGDLAHILQGRPSSARRLYGTTRSMLLATALERMFQGLKQDSFIL